MEPTSTNFAMKDIREVKDDRPPHVTMRRATSRWPSLQDMAQGSIAQVPQTTHLCALAVGYSHPAGCTGSRLHDRLEQIAASLDRVVARTRQFPGGWKRLRHLL